MTMSNPKPEDAESKSESEAIASLEDEIRELMAQKDACVVKIKELLFNENTSAGIVHAREIFTQQQDKLRLQVEVDCRRNKINRIRKFGLANELAGTPE